METKTQHDEISVALQTQIYILIVLRFVISFQQLDLQPNSKSILIQLNSKDVKLNSDWLSLIIICSA
jgi:hypothetical protein